MVSEATSPNQSLRRMQWSLHWPLRELKSACWLLQDRAHAASRQRLPPLRTHELLRPVRASGKTRGHSPLCVGRDLELPTNLSKHASRPLFLYFRSSRLTNVHHLSYGQVERLFLWGGCEPTTTEVRVANGAVYVLNLR